MITGEKTTLYIPSLQTIRIPSFLFLIIPNACNRLASSTEASCPCVWHESLSSNSFNFASLKFLAFLYVDSRQYRNHRLQNDGTKHGTLFYWKQHFRQLFNFECISAAVSFEWSKKSNTSRRWRLFASESDICLQLNMAAQKITNVLKRFVYHMHMQHLPLEPSIDKQREIANEISTTHFPLVHNIASFHRPRLLN